MDVLLNLNPSMVRKGLFLLLLVLIAGIVYFWSLIAYGLGQGWGQLKVVYEARPVEEFLIAKGELG